jgi:proline iminopeptidase
MTELSAYLDYSSAPDRRTGGVRRIPITTPNGEFSVWLKRVGNNPNIRLLLLPGGQCKAIR